MPDQSTRACSLYEWTSAEKSANLALLRVFEEFTVNPRMCILANSR